MATVKEQVLGAAIQLERDGRKFYLEAASKTASDLARKMFEALAEDELRHIEWIKAVSSGGSTTESANRELYGRLRPIFTDVSDDVQLSVLISEDDLEAIEIAIGMEEKSFAAYEQWAEESDNEDVCYLCKVLAGQERFHRQLLDNTRVYLDRTTDWFMQEEQWNFEGG